MQNATASTRADLPTRRAELLAWYRSGHRELPWRATRDPYRIWVSEIMLQQTRVETVLGYYERFLARFPDVESLASAPLDDVLAAWSGLGYYRRARFLKSAALQLIRDHAGRFPRTVDGAQTLPGIGRSTAGAIVSIAYGARAPVLDGNVKRVLARLFALHEPDGPALERLAWPRALDLVNCDDAGDVNQALMELGATTCLPLGAARCDACPWRGSCAARRRGEVATLPVTRPRAPLRAETWAVAIARKGDAFLIRRRGPTGLLHGLLELPTFEVGGGGTALSACRSTLARELPSATGLDVQVGAELLLHRQVISNRRVTMRAFAVTATGRPRAPARYLSRDEIVELAVTMATRKIVTRLLAEPAAASVSVPRASRSRP